DGIRDATVTGVQTCALPISHRLQGQNEKSSAFAQDPVLPRDRDRAARVAADIRLVEEAKGQIIKNLKKKIRPLFLPLVGAVGGEIGRASCRERVSLRRGCC